MLIALTRAVPASINDCELTHVAREPIDLRLAERQHADYEAALSRAGCRVVRLPPAPELPDSVFVEDTAVVLPAIAVITRPGVSSRRPECVSVADTLATYRALAWIKPPGTVDGGDILVIGSVVYVGVGARTNLEGFRQLEGYLARHGHVVRAVEARGCLHLKSAATRVAASTVLLNPAWIDRDVFNGLERIEVDPGERFAANALPVGETVLVGSAFPRTRSRLEARGIGTTAVDLSELAKAEGALTCCSLILEES
jgi:dimethylargininase